MRGLKRSENPNPVGVDFEIDLLNDVVDLFGIATVALRERRQP
jgi:hypothetical protein